MSSPAQTTGTKVRKSKAKAAAGALQKYANVNTKGMVFGRRFTQPALHPFDAIE